MVWCTPPSTEGEDCCVATGTSVVASFIVQAAIISVGSGWGITLRCHRFFEVSHAGPCFHTELLKADAFS